jgi:hypothetical protein
VQTVTSTPIVHDWTKGQKVLGNGGSIAVGTVIATFNSAGKDPNMSHGNRPRRGRRAPRDRARAPQPTRRSGCRM